MTDAAPLYARVKAHITAGILSGAWPPGAKLPSEHELVASLSVSRMTVNRALRELMRDGLITRLQGVGSFVSEARPVTSLAEIQDIRDIVAARGALHRCVVRTAETVAADPATAALLECAPGEAVHHIVLLHLEDETPLQLERRFVAKSFAPALLAHDFARESLYAVLQAIAPETDLEHVVEAGLPDADEAALLRLAPDAPVLRVRRRTWVGGRAVTLGYFSHPADRYRVAVRLKPNRTP